MFHLIWFIGYPAEVYGFGTQIFMSTCIFVLFVPASIYIFMIVFYKMKLTSVYEVMNDSRKENVNNFGRGICLEIIVFLFFQYLEYRFESRFIRRFASFIFMLQMAVFMGVCLFAPSIALSAFIGFELWQSVIGLGLCATIYTSMVISFIFDLICGRLFLVVVMIESNWMLIAGWYQSRCVDGCISTCDDFTRNGRHFV